MYDLKDAVCPFLSLSCYCFKSIQNLLRNVSKKFFLFDRGAAAGKFGPKLFLSRVVGL